MIEKLLPPSVVSAERFGDTGDAPLYPEEERAVAAAVPKRRNEYATVRACAREALAVLGAEPGPILSGVRGAPIWPQGVVGSMTHCTGYRGAAVSRSARVLALGLDAEPHAPIPDPGTVELVTLPVERLRLRELAARRPEIHWEKVLFSAKESVYKAWFPLTGLWLDFQEAELTIDPAAGVFRARFLVPGPVVRGGRLPGFEGRWLVEGGLVLTAVTVTTDFVEATARP